MRVRPLVVGIAASAVISLAGNPTTARASQPPHRTVRVSGSGLLNLAQELARRGSSQQAKDILSVVSHDPDPNVRNEARFRHSKLLEADGMDTDAALLLRTILDERPDAAPVRLELAQVLDRMGDKEAAWREIRAVNTLGLPSDVARLVDRYSEALRVARPWGFNFEIAMAPDSNINRATRSDTLGTVLGDFEIAGDGRAKSGIGLSLRSQAYRRVALGESSLLLRASGFADLYRAKEFNDIAVDLAAGPELELGPGRLNLELGLTQRWFGQKPFQRSARAGASLFLPLRRRALVRVNASAAVVDNQFNDLQDGKVYAGQVVLERALSTTTGIAGSFSLDRQSLHDAGYSTTGWRAALTAWREFGRMTLTMGAEMGRLRADERLILFPEKRSDRYSRFSVGATFRQLQLRGFAPVLRLSIERNRSTIEFYDYRRTRTELGFVRAF